MLIFKLERRQNVQNVGNWTGYLNVILIRKIFSIISVVVIMLRVIIILEILTSTQSPIALLLLAKISLNGLMVCLFVTYQNLILACMFV